MLTASTTSDLALAFRMTPGWSSLGVMTIGLLSLAGTVWYNRKSLRAIDARHAKDAKSQQNAQIRGYAVEVFGEAYDYGVRSILLAGWIDKCIKNETDPTRVLNLNLRRRDEQIHPIERRLMTAAQNLILIDNNGPATPIVESLLAILSESMRYAADSHDDRKLTKLASGYRASAQLVTDQSAALTKCIKAQYGSEIV